MGGLAADRAGRVEHLLDQSPYRIDHVVETVLYLHHVIAGRHLDMGAQLAAGDLVGAIVDSGDTALDRAVEAHAQVSHQQHGKAGQRQG